MLFAITCWTKISSTTAINILEQGQWISFQFLLLLTLSNLSAGTIYLLYNLKSFFITACTPFYQCFSRILFFSYYNLMHSGILCLQ